MFWLVSGRLADAAVLHASGEWADERGSAHIQSWGEALLVTGSINETQYVFTVFHRLGWRLQASNSMWDGADIQMDYLEFGSDLALES